MDAEIRAAERAGDQALVRRLRRRAGAIVQVGDEVKCVAALVSAVRHLVGMTGTVVQVTEILSVRVLFPGVKWAGRGGGRDPVDDGLSDLGWWLLVREYEVIE